MKHFAILTIVLFLPAVAHGAAPPQGDASPPAAIASWHLYRNDTYRFTLRYPPDYVIVEPSGQPQPVPALRVWFQERSMAGSPIAIRLPPQFAVDIYENPSRQSVDAWLGTSGVARDLTRFAREPVHVGGVEGIRLTDRAQLAPNVFNYVARGPFVYRFIPLGTLAYEMLATVSFTH